MLAERKRLYFKICCVLYLIYLPMLIKCGHCNSAQELIEFLNSPEAWTLSINLRNATSGVIVIGSMVYWLIVACMILNMKNYRFDEEYGSAKFGNKHAINRMYACKTKMNGEKAKLWNTRLSQCVSMGLDVQRHLRNLNVLIFGGSGTGKTRGFIFPNLLMANCSFVITDPKGEILNKIGKFLIKIRGYKIRVLDLKNHIKSHGYNPFKYFRGDDDILKFVTQSWEAMSDKTAAKGEQVWDDQAKNMYISLIMYLFHYAPEDEQNFDTVMKLIQEIKASEGAKQEITAVDILFEGIDHTSATYGYYKGWSAAKGRTLASIVATLTAKLTVFNLESLRKLTYYDELDFAELATEKVALFCVIPDNDTSYNFLAGTMYSQLIQELYRLADDVFHGPLPMHVRFLMDEFANIALPDNYEKILSTARSRNMSFAIILQNKAQIEALYEKVYKSLIGNCDSFLFLGSPEYETCKYFSDLIGKETVYVKTRNVTRGSNPSSTTNEQKIGRELLMPDELRKLNNGKCVLMIRGEDPVIDNKIKLRRCRNYKHMADGRRYKKNAYDWGTADLVTGSFEVLPGNYQGCLVPLPPTNAKLVDIILY